MSMNANAMARVGLLFLRNGLWSNGRIVSESFVNTVKTPRPEIASAANPQATDFPGATTNYGVLWWTNAQGLLPNVPRDAYWAWGQWDSLIVVIPSLDLVIARIGPEHPDAAGSRVFGEFGWNGDYAVLAPFLDPIVQSVAP
jgi:CubicO group peptidase (beta-lactamase class C family)